MEKRKEFHEWINKKFIEWEELQGTRKNITEFSEYLGVNRILVSKWLSGERLPGNDNVIKLANRLSIEIYDLLGWEKPECYK